MPQPSFQNRILNHLAPDVIARLHLKPVDLPSGRTIESPGEPIHNLFFLEAGIGSMTTTFLDGFQVEVGMFGWESVMGTSALIGTRLSLNKVYMQMDGRGFACPIVCARTEFARSGRFQELVLRYVQAQLVQTAQSAGCNAHHHIEQRLARWLCICSDRAQTNVLDLTQEYLADMLGANRPTVTIAADILRKKKLIEYARGRVTIFDRPGLEAAACECYHVVKNHLDNYLEVKQD